MYSRFVFILYMVFAIILATLVTAAPMTAMTPGQKISENRLNQGRACIRFCMFLNATTSAQPSNTAPSSEPMPIPTASSTEEDPTTDGTSESEVDPISEPEVAAESSTAADSEAAPPSESPPPEVDPTPVVNSAASTNGAFRSQTATLSLPAMIAAMSLLFLL